MKVLYITYNGLTEPLGRRQVLPYLVGGASRAWEYIVLSFEKKETADTVGCSQVREQLEPAGISWIRLRYHRRPAFLATACDAAAGLLRSLRSGKDVGLIHARSTVPAAMAAVLSKILKVPWIFDVRGLLAEEYADAEHWSRGGVLFRLTDRAEKQLLRRAPGLVFLTQRIRGQLLEAHHFASDVPTAVIPCGVDLGIFRPSSGSRDYVRRELGLGAEPLLAYAGSLGSWYRFREMAEFFLVAERQIRGLRFLVLTPEITLAQDLARQTGIESRVLTRAVRPEDVPAYLSAADAGICFLVDAFSKNASSPTKYGEYLASGLPVITNRWTGDAALLEGAVPWILVDGFSQGDYQRAAQRLATLLRSPNSTRSAARALAEKEFNLEECVARYDRLYRQVLFETAG